MLTKRIIPCLDVKDGRVVKGVSFVNLRDAGDPVEVAAIYDREGADELCFLDITASHENRKTIIDVVEQTAARVFMPVTVGGGVRTLDDIRALLNAGADKVSINTTAVQQPEFVREAAQRFGTQCIVVAIDAKRQEAGGLGIRPEQHAARFQGGSLGVLQGTRSYILQDDFGQIQSTHSVSAGLDYAAVGPEHAYLKDASRAEYTYATDDQALEAFMKLARLEGIIPALESAHAVAECMVRAPKMPQDALIIVNLSGRGDKDVAQVADKVGLQMPK